MRAFKLIKVDGTVFNYTNMPVNMKTDWFEFASTDDALLHAFLIMSALHICILRGRTSSVDAFRHQTKLVKLLNDRLSDPILSCLDSTILVISCLALIEVRLIHLYLYQTIFC